MRADMFKVLVERARRGSRYTRKGRDVELPTCVGMGRRYNNRTKELNENLSPLYRFLRGAVGRPWDKVYSEICEHISIRSTVQEHVRGHIKDIVDYQGAPTQWYRKVHELYVGSDGILKKNPRYKSWRESRPEKPVLEIEINSTRSLKKIGGIWYQFNWKPLPKAEYVKCTIIRKVRVNWRYPARFEDREVEVGVLTTPRVRDVEGQMKAVGPHYDEYKEWQNFKRANPKMHYMVGKKQLSSKELKQYKLQNEN